MAVAQKRYLACLWVRNLDQKRHYKMKQDIRDDYVRSRVDTMPKDYVEAMRVVDGYNARRARERGRQKTTDPNLPGVAMVSTDDGGGRAHDGGRRVEVARVGTAGAAEVDPQATAAHGDGDL